MELKAKLLKPYTLEQKANFIIVYQNQQNCKITETDTALEAWYSEEEQTQKREANFKAQFFEIQNFGWYRKVPKGYSSAVESLNTAFNVVSILGKLPADMLIFYATPDFSDPEQCTEEWLVAHQTKNQEMTKQEFGQFYVLFMTAWNTQEHVNLESEGE